MVGVAIPPIKAIDPKGSLNMASEIISVPIRMLGVGKAGWDIQWTGAPTGVLTIEGSLDHVMTIDQTNGTWTDLGVPMPNPAGTANNNLVSMPAVCVPWLRVHYRPTGGNGSLTVWVTTKL